MRCGLVLASYARQHADMLFERHICCDKQGKPMRSLHILPSSYIAAIYQEHITEAAVVCEFCLGTLRASKIWTNTQAHIVLTLSTLWTVRV